MTIDLPVLLSRDIIQAGYIFDRFADTWLHVRSMFREYLKDIVESTHLAVDHCRIVEPSSTLVRFCCAKTFASIVIALT